MNAAGHPLLCVSPVQLFILLFFFEMPTWPKEEDIYFQRRLVDLAMSDLSVPLTFPRLQTQPFVFDQICSQNDAVHKFLSFEIAGQQEFVSNDAESLMWTPHKKSGLFLRFRLSVNTHRL